MRIGTASPSVITDFWTAVEPRVRLAGSLEEAAQALVEKLYHEFRESVVLARVFCTVPYDGLPPINRRFVERLTQGTEAARSLGTATPVLSLVGTRGVESDWGDRRNSRGHLGIPLISAAFVDAIPMISMLLKELGIPLAWVDRQDSAMIEKTIGRTAGLFFVEDATESRDHRGRRVISAEQFVSAHGVKGTFGVGGTYVGGQIVVLVVFCRDLLPRSAAECFMALTALFKEKTAPLVGRGRIFSAP
jgi:hypothetical protein